MNAFALNHQWCLLLNYYYDFVCVYGRFKAMLAIWESLSFRFHKGRVSKLWQRRKTYESGCCS